MHTNSVVRLVLHGVILFGCVKYYCGGELCSGCGWICLMILVRVCTGEEVRSCEEVKVDVRLDVCVWCCELCRDLICGDELSMEWVWM